ncbi:thioeseterase [Salipiger aestuarii]|uniref:Acyl-CoA thioesterase FadM n=1 Tax=Salipiger aestuarii TaxID=568098 RepID=A0A327Y102_9RHOB|nr:acyl-CoA thioesterase [Salipiger aestuarii]EIE49808.1 hypothetical protein C357_17308 [Citreicella sp. 357]KAA8606993.1 thioeseterase [Salipiger aestuarii]KAA8610742.1 thioeseterase [Salipiger aestuarii]KAB2541521.1 thioeseterase [Salipiger aestuarii]RAK14127.1 acyl-CoA thioesterase FadM [Salipiger aestuarii]
MYPFIRMAKEMAKFRNADPLGVNGMHVSHHTCWPWDIDLWRELNNGRTLTLYDLGRIPLATRTGLIGVLKREGWGLTVAGACVRYRRRIRVFETFEMRSHIVGWDARFIYLEQSMWRQDGICANHAVYRGAITGPGGIVPPTQVLTAMGHDTQSPPLPEFVQKWIDAEDVRPWPPRM